VEGSISASRLGRSMEKNHAAGEKNHTYSHVPYQRGSRVPVLGDSVTRAERAIIDPQVAEPKLTAGLRPFLLEAGDRAVKEDKQNPPLAINGKAAGQSGAREIRTCLSFSVFPIKYPNLPY